MAAITIERDGLCLTVEVRGACLRDDHYRCRYVDYIDTTADVVLVEADESDDVRWRVGTTVELTKAERERAEDALLAEVA